MNATAPTAPSSKVSGVEDREVGFDQGKEDGADHLGAKNTGNVTQPKTEQEIIDVLKPAQVERTIGKGEYERTYIQREISFANKMEWFAQVGKVLDEAMGGPNPLTVNALLERPGGPSSLTMNDFRNADTFVHAIGKLLVYAPDFLMKSYCIWLNVPNYEHDLVIQLMKLPADEGGLSDDEGFDIIATFIDQNYEALDRFFRDRLSQLQEQISKRVESAQESRQSKP